MLASGSIHASCVPAVFEQNIPSAAPAVVPTKTDFSRMGKEIEDIVRRNFYDARRAEVWSERYRDYAEHITDEETFARQTKAALMALRSSHTAYYCPDDPQFYG